MKHGEVRWYEFQPPDKRRPALILTRNSAIPYLERLTIAPITTNIREIPSEVLLTTDDGLFAECAINLDHVQTVPKTQLGPLIAVLAVDRMSEVKQALNFALGLDNPLYAD